MTNEELEAKIAEMNAKLDKVSRLLEQASNCEPAFYLCQCRHGFVHSDCPLHYNGGSFCCGQDGGGCK